MKKALGRETSERSTKSQGVSEVFTRYSRRIHALPSPFPYFLNQRFLKILKRPQSVVALPETPTIQKSEDPIF
jgi:hypothetical protein